MVANFNNGQSGEFTRVTKDNPCPHCGKPDWCYSIGELSVCSRDDEPAEGWVATSKSDTDGHYFYAPIQEKKSVRPAKITYYDYQSRSGSPLVRTKRIDFGDGRTKMFEQQHWDIAIKEWVTKLGKVERASIPIYRYAEVQKAKAKGELIFIVDGESCADRLWEIGLAATTSIGGMGKWRDTDTNDLDDAKVVIVVDRDTPGIKDAAKVSEHFPEAQWLYPYPESKAWNNPPKSQGLDIKDWIEQHSITADDIKAVIGEKKVFNPAAQSNSKVVKTSETTSNVVPLFPETLDLGGAIDALIEANLRKSELTIEIAKLSVWYRQTHSVIYKIYQEREEELQQQNNQDYIASELAQLLASQSVRINLLEILPQGLAEGITRIAKTLNLKPECYVLALLTQVSALLKPGTSTMLYPQTSFKVCPNYFGATIGESSQKKTPIKVAVISAPMEQLIDASVQAFESAKVANEEEVNLWKKSDQADKGLMPKPPAQRIYHITAATGESIPKQAARMPDQSLLWVADELAGTFKSANQYRGGKGSDEENLLEYWSGGGAAVLRAEGLAVNARNIGLSIFGNIQPKVLAQFLKDGEDDNGKFARFDFVQQPLAATELSEDAPNVNISPMLADLYKRLDPLPAQKFKLDKEARKVFIAYYNQCERERINHLKQGMRAMLGKAPEKVGKVATILHCIDSAFRCVEVSESIPVEIVQAAIKWVTYTTSQALSVNLEICDSTALAPSLDKIISLARKKGGVVTARDAQNSFNHKLKITSQQVKEWFAQLESMKYGKVSTANKSVLFTLAAENEPTVVTVVNRSHTVDESRLQSEPLQHKDLTPTVVTVVTVLPPSENSDNQLLDLQNQPLTTHTVTTVASKVDADGTEPDYSTQNPLTAVTTVSAAPAIVESIREAIANVDQAAAKAAWQEIKNSQTQQQQVKSQLTPEENLNFRLLLNAGWLKGTRVKYIGAKFAEQYAGIELTINDLRDRNGITCTKPDGSYTTDLNKEDLEKIEQPLTDSVSAKPIANCDKPTEPEVTEPMENGEVSNES